jgi:serine/threonine protein kinase
MLESTPDRLVDALVALGKFTIGEEICEGANARAFQAENTHLRRRVFLKVYHYDDAYRAEALAEPRLLVEATTSPSSDHLVQIHEAEIIAVGDEQYLCVQMEMVEGSSLLREIQARRFAQQDGVRIAIGILLGVLHLHNRRILHRDLKPANILLDETGPRIADFGSARLLADGASHVPASKHSALYSPAASS